MSVTSYVNGYLYALAGGTSRHNRISLNIAAHLLGLAQGKPCRVYQEGMKLRIQNEGTLFTTPT